MVPRFYFHPVSVGPNSRYDGIFQQIVHGLVRKRKDRKDRRERGERRRLQLPNFCTHGHQEGCWDASCHLCREHNPEEDPAGEDSLCTLLEKRQRRENRDPDLGQ